MSWVSGHKMAHEAGLERALWECRVPAKRGAAT